uniref:Predicted nuclease, contains PIN domain, potential toxin-antitoxin system component n=1 Tax=Candidatus Kentrum sp. FM TaxID=2126340 RepID=A0A450VTM5_9GAMM|nr:MAG: Predicted nuclease, contains PIN domain, potential toxin-antitoxin system component [Candidatus Kentron sp. FM]VFJ58945.1 MAG: Predicted nuclease, contains PIN domain, potential toxin-antitoxin system component [Candidatus Kentron sp. FM]VFK08143.1 MAG: Predicted nuclease, contains PIN domain, potential toxin-antitoxin system component [Candidatus Kentron sp. FM]
MSPIRIQKDRPSGTGRITIWIDAQLSPSLAKWITGAFGVSSRAVRDLDLRDAKDFPIFQAARRADVVILTKDADFPHLVKQHGPPPKILWLTCGNTSNQNLREILSSTLIPALRLLDAGESIIEITGPTG